MTHNPETADRHYALYNQRELAVTVTNMISAVMEGRKPAKSTVNIMKSIHWLKENETDNITQDWTQKGDPFSFFSLFAACRLIPSTHPCIVLFSFATERK
jgi:hypothetical protein